MTSSTQLQRTVPSLLVSSSSTRSDQRVEWRGMRAVLKYIECGPEEDLLSALGDFNELNKANFQLDASDEERQLFCRCTLSRLSAVPPEGAPPTPLLPQLLTALRILSRERRGLDDLLCAEGVGVVLKRAELKGGAAQSGFGQRDKLEIDTVVEAVKCLFNIVLNNRHIAATCCDLGALEGLAARLCVLKTEQLPFPVQLFDVKLLFLLTSIQPQARSDFRDSHEGMTLLLTLMDQVVMEHTPEGGQPEGRLVERRQLLQLESPLEKAELDLLSDVCKVVFNMTMSWRANEEDYHDDERALWNCFVHLSRVLCNSLQFEDDQTTRNVLQCVCDVLLNMPSGSAACFVSPPSRQEAAAGGEEPEHVFNGFDMSAVSKVLHFLQWKLAHNEAKPAMSIVGTLRNLAYGHRSVRKYLRAQILPPLGRITQRPDEGDSLKSSLVRHMTASSFGIEDVVSDLLFVLCKENVRRFVKHVGYGHAAGLLMARGLLGGGASPNVDSYSPDEDSDTEEYRESVANMDPVTGGPAQMKKAIESMTTEEQEVEARKLEDAIARLNRSGIIEVRGVDGGGRTVAGGPQVEEVEEEEEGEGKGKDNTD